MFTNKSIDWGAKKQKVVSLSSMESQVNSSCVTAVEAAWIGKFWNELDPGYKIPINPCLDSQAAI